MPLCSDLSNWLKTLKGFQKNLKILSLWFRNGIVHEYGKTDYTIVYEIITDGLDQLEDVLHKIQ